MIDFDKPLLIPVVFILLIAYLFMLFSILGFIGCISILVTKLFGTTIGTVFLISSLIAYTIFLWEI